MMAPKFFMEEANEEQKGPRFADLRFRLEDQSMLERLWPQVVQHDGIIGILFEDLIEELELVVVFNSVVTLS